METLPAPPGESVWRSPLLPPALAVTAGVVADRLLAPPFAGVLLTGAVFVAAAAVAGKRRLGILYLLVALAAVGAAYHQWRCGMVRPDEVALLADREPRPARLRGVLVEGPRRLPARAANGLFTYRPEATASALLRVTHVAEAGGEREASGTVRLLVSGKTEQPPETLLPGLLPGDEVEATGRLRRIDTPANPGEFDASRHWAAREVRAVLRLRPDAGSVRRLREGWRTSPSAWLGYARDEAHAALHRELGGDPPIESLARAPLLGEGAPMTNDAWAKYVRTGVVHVLAISGQHLVVLAAMMWFVSFRLGLRQRRVAVFVALALLGYALLTGGRPPALRAAVVCAAAAGAVVFRRWLLPGNAFALAWLVVLAVNPAAVLEVGCQLSFLAVAVLSWCVPRFFTPPEPDPLEELIDEARPPWLRRLRWVGGLVGKAYLANLLVWGALTPLAAFHTNLVSPAALLLGPPLMLLTSIALVLGFALLAAAPPGLAFLFARPLYWTLLACEGVVDVAETFPVHAHVGDIPAWWVAAFYVGLFAVFTCPPLLARWRTAVPAAVGWLALLLLLGAMPRSTGELRCTFLDVGHGGCVVLELPDGRVVLFDAGAMRGPDVAARTVAPFLRERRIGRIDDLILSHPDLDHINGVAGLAERFAVGRVLTADSFAEKKTSAVGFTLDELSRRKVRTEVIGAGDRLGDGDLTLDVLHPPRGWLRDNANENSLAILVRHGPRSLLLTGDLEGEGLARLLRQPPREIDVVQAPHHGSGRADVEGLLRWCRPRLAVSCQGAPTGGRTGQRYGSGGVEFRTTWEHGAITLRSDGAALRVRGHRGAAWESP